MIEVDEAGINVRCEEWLSVLNKTVLSTGYVSMARTDTLAPGFLSSRTELQLWVPLKEGEKEGEKE
jgi:hypothetical protein